jgi:cytoskeletal protein RodZ
MVEELPKNITEEISLGKFLQQRRQELQMEIEKISAALRVKPRDLLSIEEDKIDQLIKRGLYAPGLIRSYAKHLKIEEKEIEKKISNLTFKSNTENKKHTLLNIGGESEITPPKDDFFNFLLISALLFLILLSIYNSFESKDSLITSQDLIQQLENAKQGSDQK